MTRFFLNGAMDRCIGRKYYAGGFHKLLYQCQEHEPGPAIPNISAASQNAAQFVPSGVAGLPTKLIRKSPQSPSEIQ